MCGLEHEVLCLRLRSDFMPSLSIYAADMSCLFNGIPRDESRCRILLTYKGLGVKES